jgi:hypothetical protein
VIWIKKYRGDKKQGIRYQEAKKYPDGSRKILYSGDYAIYRIGDL